MALVRNFSRQSNRKVRRPRRARRGVILVFVLLFLALCSAILVRSHSMVTRSMVQAARAEKELQIRWAKISIRRSLLMNSDAMLDASPVVKSQTNPANNGLILATKSRLAVSQIKLALSGQRYLAILEDENAKLPLNRLLASKPYDAWRSEIRNLIASNLSMRQKLVSKNLERWGDFFQSPIDSNQSFDTADDLIDATKHITLFTNNLVNYRSASPKILNALWRIHFRREAPECIHAMRKYQPPFNIAQYCRGYGLSDAESTFAGEIFTDSCQCCSLTIIHKHAGTSLDVSRFYRRTKEGYADDHFGDPGW